MSLKANAEVAGLHLAERFRAQSPHHELYNWCCLHTHKPQFMTFLLFMREIFRERVSKSKSELLSLREKKNPEFLAYGKASFAYEREELGLPVCYNNSRTLQKGDKWKIMTR